MRPELRDIPTEDLVAIRGYTSADYQILNTALRSGDAAKLKALEPYIKCAESGLSQLPSFKGTVYRGTTLPPHVVQDYLPNKIVTESGFTSTSVDELATFSGDTKMVIFSSKGKDISVLSEFADEKEILFAPGTQFRVLASEIDDANGVRKIFMRELSEGGNK